jgi:hypothetical protein
VDLATTMRGSLRTAIDHGHSTGRIAGLEDGRWIVWAWQEIGPKWIAIAVGDGETDATARALAEERLQDEVRKHVTV